MSACDSSRGAAGTVWLLHVRSRWFVGAEWYQPRIAVYDIDQTQVGQEHASELKKYKQVECDIAIHWSRSDILPVQAECRAGAPERLSVAY